MSDSVIKWQCPICKGRAYQKYGGYTAPAKRIYKTEEGEEVAVESSVHMGTHFMCKGCSVFFANPRQFNLVSVSKLNQ